MSGLVARLVDYSDYLNPVLVREVKQALRGRFFVIVFALTLIFAMVSSISVLLLSEIDDQPGQNLFTACIGFLTFAACMLVPIGAFQSLGGEHDDKTRDLLVLSNLSPGQIIRGKFFTFFLLGLLFTISLAPFFALCALLNGIDLLTIGKSLVMTIIQCVNFLMLGICLSSLAPQRGMRVLMLLAMIMLMFMLSAGAVPLRIAFGGGPGLPAGALVGTAFFSAIFVSFTYILACTRFTHEEENRSTPLRIHITGLVFSVNILLVLFSDLTSGVLTPTSPSAWWLSTGTILLSLGTFSFASLFFASEPSTLSRYVRARVPKSRLRALLAYPFLPGGGKAVAWYLCNSLAYLVLVGIVSTVGTPRSIGVYWLEFGVFIICATLVYFLLLSALLRPLTRRASSRRWLIFLPIIFLMLTTFATEIYRTALHGGGATQLWRIGSPFGLLDELTGTGTYGMTGVWILYGSFAALSLLINSVRMISEARGLAAASRFRRTATSANG